MHLPTVTLPQNTKVGMHIVGNRHNEYDFIHLAPESDGLFAFARVYFVGAYREPIGMRIERILNKPTPDELACTFLKLYGAPM